MPPRQNLTPAERRAKLFARAWQYLLEAGLDPASRPMVFAHVYLEGFGNAETMRRYGLALGRYFAWCRARGLDPFAAKRSDANVYNAHVTGLGWADETRKLEVTVARSYYRAAFEDGEAPLNPFSHIRLGAEVETETPALLPSDIDRVLDAIAAARPIRSVDQRDYALVYTASRVGPRRKELRGLCWGDLIAAGRASTVRFSRKGGLRDTINLPDDVVAVLDAWRGALAGHLGRRVRMDEPVFPSIGVNDRELRRARRGTLLPMCLQLITNTCKARFADVGLEGPRMATHALRASAATIAFEAGAALEDIQLMLGHRKLATTWGYIKRIRRQSAATTWTPRARPFPTAVKRPGSLLAIWILPSLQKSILWVFFPITTSPE